MKKNISIIILAFSLSAISCSCGTYEPKNTNEENSDSDITTESTITEVSETEQITTELIEDTEATEEQIELNWYLEPSVEADDINVISQYSSGVNKSEVYHGYFSDADYLMIFNKGKYGVIDYKGNEILPNKYDNINMSYYDNRHVMTSESEMYCIAQSNVAYNNTSDGPGFCTVCGKNTQSTMSYYFEYAYDCNYKQLIRVGYVNNGTIYLGSESSGFGAGLFQNDNDLFTVFNVSLNAGRDSGISVDQIQATINNPKFGAIKNNETIVEFIYDNVTGFGEFDIAAFSKNGKWGYINSDGKEIIPFEYDAQFRDQLPQYFEGTQSNLYPYNPTEGLISLNKGDDAGYYDINGNEIIPVGTFEKARPVYDGLAWVKYNGKWGIIDLSEYCTEPEKSSNAVFGIVSTDKGSLNVRSTPSTDGNIIAKFNKNTSVEIDLSQSTNGWYYVTGNSSDGVKVAGYVSADFITLEENVENETEETSISSIMSNNEMKSSVIQKYGEPEYWEYHDYDYDGNNEAFAIIATKGENNEHSIIKVLFISSSGEITDLTNSILNGGGYLHAKYVDAPSINRGFFSFTTSAGGSGSYCEVLSVKNSLPYDLDICDDYLTKIYCEDNIVYGVRSENRDYHCWIIYELNYNSSSGQFSFGKVIGEDLN